MLQVILRSSKRDLVPKKLKSEKQNNKAVAKEHSQLLLVTMVSGLLVFFLVVLVELKLAALLK